MFPKTVASESGARRDVLAEMAARIPPTLQRRHKWTEGGHRSKSETRSSSPTRLPRNTWPRGIVERVYPGIDGQVRVVDIRTAHGRLRRPTARLAVLPTEVESSHARPGWIVDGRITTALRGCRCVRRLVDKKFRGEGARGRTSHWPRGRDARARKATALGAQRCYMRARPATVSPPSTADEETLSLLRVLKQSSGPPSARPIAGPALGGAAAPCARTGRAVHLTFPCSCQKGSRDAVTLNTFRGGTYRGFSASSLNHAERRSIVTSYPLREIGVTLVHYHIFYRDPDVGPTAADGISLSSNIDFRISDIQRSSASLKIRIFLFPNRPIYELEPRRADPLHRPPIVLPMKRSS
ncbi:hypothetical protein EVAR_68028_1 [Eumeta japonica]|uniref:DUF5641 domain-containing protein n=1 Tax=Eumeta variegata TaxID=151549 RepID=A0A4C1SWZ3_EUMVA|nr:hypothetical protein EVAR_68028_1 [Eumeta japonica]